MLVLHLFVRIDIYYMEHKIVCISLSVGPAKRERKLVTSLKEAISIFPSPFMRESNIPSPFMGEGQGGGE